jgi:hypothetical protein
MTSTITILLNIRGQRVVSNEPWSRLERRLASPLEKCIGALEIDLSFYQLTTDN